MAASARVVAADQEENSFETTANAAGQFALGGLPPGSYSVFTYDKRKAWVGKSTYLPRLKAGRFKKANIDLTTRAGRLVVDLYAGDQPYPGIAYVTAVSRKNGQFWTAKAAHGTVTLGGLFPGRYDLVVPGAGSYLGGTLAVTGKVKRGKTSFGTVRLTQRGATVTGTVVDANNPSVPLGGAAVVLQDGSGATLGSVTSATDGSFTLGGQLHDPFGPPRGGRTGALLGVPRPGHALLQVRPGVGRGRGHHRPCDGARRGPTAAPAGRAAGRRAVPHSAGSLMRVWPFACLDRPSLRECRSEPGRSRVPTDRADRRRGQRVRPAP